MENFKNQLKEISHLSDDSLTDLLKICSFQNFKKNDFVLEYGKICQSMYFISKGLLRIFYYKHDKEISEWFAFENTFCFSIISYFKKTPSALIIECLEDSEIITLSRDGLQNLRNRNFEIANFAYDLVAGSLIASQERMVSLLFETAQQRYDNLMKVHQNMLQRVPLQYIASYLGVTAETLSRIRANHQ